MMFCCGSALEAQRAGTRTAGNKTKTRGSLLRSRRSCRARSPQGSRHKMLRFDRFTTDSALRKCGTTAAGALFLAKRGGRWSRGCVAAAELLSSSAAEMRCLTRSCRSARIDLLWLPLVCNMYIKRKCHSNAPQLPDKAAACAGNRMKCRTSDAKCAGINAAERMQYMPLHLH